MSHLDDIHVLHIRLFDEEKRQIVIAYLADCAGIEAIEEAEEELLIYQSDQDILKNAVSYLEKNLPFSILELFTFSMLPAHNWNEEWEKSFTPIEVMDFCIVRASFHPAVQDERLEIIIDPELAFGTGHHETTYLMMKEMKSILFDGKIVLDFGSGTAILAILAEKLGALKTLAIDYDPQATDCATTCLVLNKSSAIELKTGTLDDVPLIIYDVILANINRNVLLASSSGLALRQKKGDLLLLSGIMESDQSMIVENFVENGYKCVHIAQKAEWLCIRLERQ